MNQKKRSNRIWTFRMVHNLGSATTQLEYACCFNTSPKYAEHQQRQYQQQQQHQKATQPESAILQKLCASHTQYNKGQRGKSFQQINYACMYSAVNGMRSKLYGNSCACYLSNYHRCCVFFFILSDCLHHNRFWLWIIL